MYKDNRQLRIEDFVFPYGKPDPANDWGRLAALVSQEAAGERYTARFVNNGCPAHLARLLHAFVSWLCSLFGWGCEIGA